MSKSLESSTNTSVDNGKSTQLLDAGNNRGSHVLIKGNRFSQNDFLPGYTRKLHVVILLWRDMALARRT